MSFQRWLQNQPHCFFCVCVFSCRSLFIMFSNTACSLVPLPSCLLSIFVVIAIKYKFLARSHCLCSQWHYTFIHGWLFVAMHLAKEKNYIQKKKRAKNHHQHENYLHREKTKKTDCRLNTRTNGVRVATSQHIHTGTAKGKKFILQAVCKKQNVHLCWFIHWSEVKGKLQV